MSTTLQLIKDQNNQPLFSSEVGLPSSDINQYVLLTASTVKTVTVPQNNSPVFGSSKMVAIMRYANPTGAAAYVWMLPAASPTLTLPNGTVTDTLATLSPNARIVTPGQTLQFLTGQADIAVSISYYAI